jgi:hypothetical protein
MREGAAAVNRLALGLSLGGLAIVLAVTSRLGDGSYAVAGDAHYVYLAARSLAYDGDLDLDNQLRALGDPWGLGRDPAADGWRLPPREIAPSLLMVPGLWLAHALGLREAWAPTSAVALASLSLGLLFWLVERILARASGLPARDRIAVALVTALGLCVPYYAVGRAGYAHAPDAVVGAALALALCRRAPAFEVGLWLAAAVLFRLQNFLWLAWPAVELLRAAPLDRAHDLRRLGTIGALSLLGLAPQALLALRHPGSEQGPIRWGLDFFDLDGYPLDVLRVLAGTHGLVSWTPLAALALVGLVAAARADRRSPAGPALAVLAAQVLLVAAARDPDAGWAFGARRLAGCTAVLGLGLGLWRFAVRARPRLRRASAVLAVVLTGANLLLVALVLSGRISLRP